jgi:hypothetical protein
MDYQLDTNEARKADSTGNQIKEIGKYNGKFIQAEDITAKTGTKGVALTFESDAGQKTRISLYTKKSDGTTIMGYQALMAIMTCMSLRGIKPVAGQVMHWNAEEKKDIAQPGSIFPELCNKPVGLLLETEDYASTTGELKTRMVLQGVFQAKTELTASEILDKKTSPEQLGKMVARLRHRPIKAAPGAAAPNFTAKPSLGFDDMDDDIPF